MTNGDFTVLINKHKRCRHEFQRARKKIKSDIPALYFALTDKRTPWYAKALSALTVGYVLSPVDLIPVFIPILGCLDDIILLPAMAALVIRMIPQEVMEQCRKKAEGLWENGKPKRWYYAVPIILVWILILFLIARVVIVKLAR